MNENEKPMKPFLKVSIIDFQMTIANLSAAQHVLLEEPYPRLPYLSGLLGITAAQMERLRLEAMSLQIERDRSCVEEITRSERREAQAQARFDDDNAVHSTHAVCASETRRSSEIPRIGNGSDGDNQIGSRGLPTHST